VSPFFLSEFEICVNGSVSAFLDRLKMLSFFLSDSNTLQAQIFSYIGSVSEINYIFVVALVRFGMFMSND